MEKVVDCRYTRKDYRDYTKAHRKAFLQVEKKFLGRNTFRGYTHDLLKWIMYFVIDPKKAHNIHRNLSRHHRRARTRRDFENMVIDWESCRLTKIDKPLNAYETLYKYYPQLKRDILPILQQWGIDKTREGVRYE